MATRIVDEIEGQIQTDTGRLQQRLMSYALAALSSRALVWAAALGGVAVWAFAVARPEVLRLIAATGYCLTVLCPILWRDSKGG